jgi:DNA-directed RNA polymerase specialized sigma24 family protein
VSRYPEALCGFNRAEVDNTLREDYDETSTADIARELGISDQAVTERLRRGINTLAENTLLVGAEE